MEKPRHIQLLRFRAAEGDERAIEKLREMGRRGGSVSAARRKKNISLKTKTHHTDEYISEMWWNK